MAVVLKFRRNVTDLNLHPGPGLGLRIQKWYPKIADLMYRRIPPYVTENMDLIADRDTQDNLATTIQALDEMRRNAATQRVDPTVQYPVWLHAKMDNETGERRAYVRGIEGNWRSDPIGGIGDGGSECSNALLRLDVERHPYWEELTATDATMSATQAASVMFSYGNISGDVPARLANLVVRTETNEEVVDRLWMGMRSPKDGRIPSNFVNLWECEAGVATGDDVSAPQADASASPGGGGNTRRECDFATQAGWRLRLRMNLNVFTSNYTDQNGHFLWLFRAKVDAGTTCEVYLRFQHHYQFGGDAYITGPTVEITNSSGWDYQEMGECSIPLVNRQAEIETGQPLARNFSIFLYARRTAGSGSLYLDCLCPIPLDEGWLIAKEIEASYVLNAFNFLQLPDDRSVCYRGLDGQIDDIPQFSHQNFALPPGNGGRMIIVYAARPEDGDPSSLSYGITVQASKRYHRWINLRGSE
jgi:hypothetical protein